MLNNLPNGFKMMFENGVTVAVVFSPNGHNSTAVADADICVYNEEGDYIHEITKWENSEQFLAILNAAVALGKN